LKGATFQARRVAPAAQVKAQGVPGQAAYQAKIQAIRGKRYK